MIRRCRHENQISDLQREIAIRHIALTISADCADQHLRMHDLTQRTQLGLIQRTLGINAEFHDFHVALGKRINFQKARIFQQTRNFMRSLTFRIDCHVQREYVAHLKRLAPIFRIPDPPDGMQLRIHAMCSHAGKQVDFICIGCGNQKVGFLHICLLQHIHAGRISLNRNHIIGFHDVFKYFCLAVNNSNFVSLSRKLCGQSRPDLSASGNDNLHKPPDGRKPRQMPVRERTILL